jgi:hypothetical protein
MRQTRRANTAVAVASTGRTADDYTTTGGTTADRSTAGWPTSAITPANATDPSIRHPPVDPSVLPSHRLLSSKDDRRGRQQRFQGCHTVVTSA